MKSLLWLTAVTAIGVFSSSAGAAAAPLHEIAVRDIDGRMRKLEEFRGQALLIVNVASECGYTSQYAGLQSLYEKYRAQGLVVLAFPCNQFGGQEPGTAADIKKFCTTNFSVTFPLFDKIDATGERRHPLFALLTGKTSPQPGDVKWNFEKFLVGRDGKLLQRFSAGAEPDDEELVRAVEAALKKA